jgi:hypothetical protein
MGTQARSLILPNKYDNSGRRAIRSLTIAGPVPFVPPLMLAVSRTFVKLSVWKNSRLPGGSIVEGYSADIEHDHGCCDRKLGSIAG